DHTDGRGKVHVLAHVELVVADVDDLPVVAPLVAGLDAVAGDGVELFRLLQSQSFRFGPSDNGPGNRMFTQALGPGGDAKYILPAVVVQWLDVGEHRFAVGEGAGLVEGQDIQVCALFQIDAALEENAAARRRRNGAQDAGRRADDQ